MAKYDNIPQHPGYYISRQGLLYSRILPGSHKLGDKYKRRNKKYSLSDGKYAKYYRVEIQGKKYYIHRLVAQVYIPNPDHLPCVAHKNNNPLDNRVSNLYWCTLQENMIQIVKDGRNPSYVVRVEIGKLYAEGAGIMEITRATGLSKHIVQKSIQQIFKDLWQQREK